MLFKMSNEGERKTQGKKKCAHKTHPHIFANVYSIKKRTKSKIPATTKTRATKNKQQINGEKKQQQQQKALIYITKIIIFHSPIVLKKNYNNSSGSGNGNGGGRQVLGISV